MKVRYKTLAAGPGGVIRPGDEAEVTEQLGKQLVSGGYAEAIGVKAIASVAVQEVKELFKPEKAEQIKAETKPAAKRSKR
jgi:hypothetical protein